MKPQDRYYNTANSARTRRLRTYGTHPMPMSSANYAKESEKVQRTPITNAWRSRTPSASLDLKISLRERRKENFHSIVVCEVRPQKEDPNHTCITVAGSGICYPENIGTPIGSLDLFNLMINRVLSRHNAHFV